MGANAKALSMDVALGLACVGGLLPLLAALLFLLCQHVFADYTATMMHLARYHAALWRLPMSVLFLRSVSSVLLPLFCFWLLLFLLERRWQLFEDRFLLLGLLFGVFSFCLQGRGYPYHRYPSEVFLLALASRAFLGALEPHTKASTRTPPVFPLVKILGFAGLPFGGLVVVPRSLSEVIHFDGIHDGVEQPLSADLNRLGGSALSGNVQCLEMAGGCITTLYRMRLIESSGFLYDCYLYPMGDQTGKDMAELEHYRTQFRRAFLARPPWVLLVSSDECGPPDFAYHKLERWPWLSAYLHEHYTLIKEEVPHAMTRWGGKPILPYGYRIYVARNAALPGSPKRVIFNQ